MGEACCLIQPRNDAVRHHRLVLSPRVPVLGLTDHRVIDLTGDHQRRDEDGVEQRDHGSGAEQPGQPEPERRRFKKDAAASIVRITEI